MRTKSIIVAAALAVLACGCSKEQAAVADGSEVSVSFTAEVPGVQTRAIGDGLTAKNLTVEVYEDEDGGAGANITGLRKTETFTGRKAEVKLDLVKGKTYHFIFWAQADGAPYTLNAANKTVNINYEGEANDEKRDAFYAVKTLTAQGSASETVQLHRPFAQVNFGTADFEKATAGNVTITKSAFTATEAATAFDVFAGEGKVGATITYNKAELPTETLVLENGARYKWMAMNYFIPVGKVDERHVSNVKATFTSGSHSVEVSSPSTPVQANWRTNIVGNLLTDQMTFDVEIVPAFEGDVDIDVENIKTSAALRTALANGYSVKLAEDIDLDGTISVPAGKGAVIDLNGHKINNLSTAIAINVDGSLEIKGDGTVDGGQGGNNQAVHVTETGKLVIRGGNFTVGPDATGVGNSCVECWGGSIEIYGGYFRSEAAFNGKYYVLNQKNNQPGTITVYGGRFEEYDPATGDDNLGGSFLAPGYFSKKISDTPKVYEVVAATTVGTAAELDQAIANASADDVIYLKAGTYENVIDIRSGKTITFKPVAGAAVVLAGVNCASNNTTTACTFEDITFDNSLQTSAWFTGTGACSPCVGLWGGQLNFKNCKFIVDGSSAKETGVMTWWTLETCPTALAFDGCTFEGKSTPAEARAMQIYGHVNLTVDNCTLTTAKRYAIKYAANENYTATIRNNTVSNCQYTVELGSAGYPGSKYKVFFENNHLASGIADYKIAHNEDAIISGGTEK